MHIFNCKFWIDGHFLRPFSTPVLCRENLVKAARLSVLILGNLKVSAAYGRCFWEVLTVPDCPGPPGAGPLQRPAAAGGSHVTACDQAPGPMITVAGRDRPTAIGARPGTGKPEPELRRLRRTRIRVPGPRGRPGPPGPGAEPDCQVDSPDSEYRDY